MEPAEPHGVTELKDVRVHCHAPALHCRAVLDSRDVVEHPVQPESSAVYGSCQAAFAGKLLSFLLLLSFKSLSAYKQWHISLYRSSHSASFIPSRYLRVSSVTGRMLCKERLQSRCKRQDDGANHWSKSHFILKSRYPPWPVFQTTQEGNVFFRGRTRVNEMMSVRHLDRTCQEQMLKEREHLSYQSSDDMNGDDGPVLEKTALEEK